MSSHHFVKEGQEPALILADGFSLENIGSLLEWAPFIIATGSSMESVVTQAIKADMVILTHAEAIKMNGLIPEPVQQLIIPADANAWRIAFEHLISVKSLSVNLWCREALVYLADVTRYIDKIQIGMLDHHFKWSAIRNGKFNKWMPEGSILRYSGSDRPDLINGNFDGPERISVVSDGILSIHSSAPFWIGEARV
jgi:hypothetical protein